MGGAGRLARVPRKRPIWYACADCGGPAIAGESIPSVEEAAKNHAISYRHMVRTSTGKKFGPEEER